MEGSGSTWRPATGSETSRTQLWGHLVPAAESEMVQGPTQGPLGRKMPPKKINQCVTAVGKMMMRKKKKTRAADTRDKMHEAVKNT